VKISNDSPSTSNDSTPPSFNCARLFDLTTGEALHPQKSVTPLLFDESTTLRCIQSQLTAPGLTRWSGSGSTASRCSARHGRSLGLPGSRGFGDFTSADFRTTGHGQRAWSKTHSEQASTSLPIALTRACPVRWTSHPAEAS